MPAPDIFDYDIERLADHDPVRVRRALIEHSAVYVNHLQIARWLQGWAERVEDRQGESESGSGFGQALREIAAHLRQADLIPGGLLLTEETEMAEREIEGERSR